MPSVRLLEHPSDAQVEDVVALCLRAFENDIPLKAMTGNNSSLRAPLFRSTLRAAALEGSFYVASDGSDAIFAVGIWFGPGVRFLGSEKQREQGFNDFFAALSPETKEWWTNEYGKKRDKYLDELFGSSSRIIDFWYANIVATDPLHQRKGYGSALVKQVRKRAEKDNKIIALVTQNEENTAWYESMGFRIVGETVIAAPTGDFPATFLTWGDEGTMPR